MSKKSLGISLTILMIFVFMFLSVFNLYSLYLGFGDSDLSSVTVFIIALQFFASAIASLYYYKTLWGLL